MSVKKVAFGVLRWAGLAAVLLVVGTGLLFLRGLWAVRNVPVTTVEFVPPEEAAQVLALIRKGTQAVEMASNLGPGGLVRRDVHAKPHGCVKAVLTVDDAIPGTLQHGVFSIPGRTYEAWVRFSNGTEADDRESDVRGMAIKLMGVGGAKVLSPEEDPEQSTQDFVMVNYHTFFLSDLDEYEEFFDFQVAADPIKYFRTPLWNPLAWQVRELSIAGPMLYQKVASPLATQYYSMSAYLFGPENIKFSARPCIEAMAKRRFLGFHMPEDARDNPNFLRRALIDDLTSGPACFRFMVQLQDPDERMPIEDPTIRWSESASPYRRVATLDIPQQAFATPEQDAFCERLQFAPFHAVVEQRPVGRMNRVRHQVYREVSKRRHFANGVPIGEPKPGWCLDLTGATCAPAAGPEPADPR